MKTVAATYFQPLQQHIDAIDNVLKPDWRSQEDFPSNLREIVKIQLENLCEQTVCKVLVILVVDCWAQQLTTRGGQFRLAGFQQLVQLVVEIRVVHMPSVKLRKLWICRTVDMTKMT